MEKTLFNILRNIERCMSVDTIAYTCHIPNSAVQAGINSLLNDKYIESSESKLKVTDKGQNFLKNFKADFAIIMSAGDGNRLNPVTLDTPKPLVKVQGVRMIESMINALISVGIDEIYVVTGYKAEMFAFLPEKYNNLTLVHNDKYADSNNSSTLYTVKDLMKQGRNFYICEADQVVIDPSFLHKYVNQNQYLAKFMPGEVNEWTFDIKDDRITRIKFGGCDSLNMVGITFWLAETGVYFAQVLEDLYLQDSNAKMLHWDNILDMHLDNVFIGYQEVYPSQIFEIDTFEELVSADNSYSNYKK